ncbi:hypothetical protein KGF57_000598 [Candida theae]|uniref:Uncharacterized protein n=1 Tax=Candida theae TaxID=1198502 RepID=A0AAD5G0N3_9ASCO|nr:uncharacterized protein KGF57_000598 [Candida theae]KAI5966634.1 hypothetical protein KGF57_000598 [Candida theae]
MSQAQLSPCKNHVAQIQPLPDSIVLSIFQTPQNKLHRSFQVLEVIRSKYSTNDIPTTLDISFAWEYKQSGKECQKLAVLVKNMAAVFILDIDKDEASSVLIRHPISELIESIEWIPPTVHQKDTGYANSTQLVLFSEYNLSANLYSLDCTRKLCTVYKPIDDGIIIRKTSTGSYWCLIADTFEYNVPPTLYQFLNTGSVSILVNSVRLQNFMSEEALVDWSTSGNWLQILDRNDTLSSYNLKVYGSNGSFGPDLTKPVVQLEFYNEVKEKGEIMVSKGGVHSCWCSSGETELLLLARVIGPYLEIRGVSMRLLKVVLHVTKTLEEVAAKRNSFGVVKISYLHPLVFVQLGNHIVYLFKFDIDDTALHYVTWIETQSSILDILSDESRCFIVSEHQIVLYENGVEKILLSTNAAIYSASLLDNQTIIVFAREANGEFWEYLSIKQSTQSNKSSAGSNTMDEVTDTFANRKRARFK